MRDALGVDMGCKIATRANEWNKQASRACKQRPQERGSSVHRARQVDYHSALDFRIPMSRLPDPTDVEKKAYYIVHYVVDLLKRQKLKRSNPRKLSPRR